MKYDHMVKANGKYYQAGQEVPGKSEKAVKENSLPYSNSDAKDKKREKQFTKSDINRMKTAELQDLAKNSGVEGADEMTGQELKEYLLNVFGL